MQRVTEERDILKAACTSQASPTEVRLYQSQPISLACSTDVQNPCGSSQWFLYLAKTP